LENLQDAEQGASYIVNKFHPQKTVTDMLKFSSDDGTPMPRIKRRRRQRPMINPKEVNATRRVDEKTAEADLAGAAGEGWRTEVIVTMSNPDLEFFLICRARLGRF
jgi:hypothetical protein